MCVCTCVHTCAHTHTSGWIKGKVDVGDIPFIGKIGPLTLLNELVFESGREMGFK